jgi:hypothetical protein
MRVLRSLEGVVIKIVSEVLLLGTVELGKIGDTPIKSPSSLLLRTE